MKREIIQTSDGSTTIHLPEWEESYHSKHGAIQEAYHVFIQNGLSLFRGKETVAIMEIGFGTGLNAFITFLEGKKNNQKINYTGIEAYPISPEEVGLMNYAQELDVAANAPVFAAMHDAAWETPVALDATFELTKNKLFFNEIQYEQAFDLIYFDAFGFRVQPELWSAEIFAIMYKALKPEGTLVTYAARGIIKRNMQEAGFTVTKMAGPPGKREMMRATKKNDLI
ncbi:tRNA (5-methylaminomethyl-2-thiouridine)(34)-methyltransferase MnmD [Flavobacterium kingsejongi]|uniref:SAM-dependent methyltransferase n=1 Tax=Flavobacterium kingsejongi TaxID=1678728 RepID=A0A2S1LQC5_9FLAO|nr:tRNA (5-methylaminomethyl-2-thiouridine)(34)-methyltransferase MnmD [Flavobacterium kingsejongi]AWG25871.1 SAM-dependent methyltransferase [Flavobacterium kingsejongi]